MTAPVPRPLPRRNVPWFGLLVLELLVAVSGWYGGIGLLAGNAIRLPPAWVLSLPFQSTVFAGAALLVFVALPMTVAAIEETFRRPRAYPVSVVAALALIVWIFAQWAIIQDFFFLQPVMLTAGLAVAIGAWWIHEATARDTGDADRETTELT